MKLLCGMTGGILGVLVLCDVARATVNQKQGNEVADTGSHCLTLSNSVKIITCPNLDPYGNDRSLFFRWRDDMPQALQEFNALESFALSEQTTQVRSEIIAAEGVARKDALAARELALPLYDAWEAELDELLGEGRLYTRLYFLDGYLLTADRADVLDRLIASLDHKLMYLIKSGLVDEALLIKEVERRMRVSRLLDGGMGDDLEENGYFLSTTINKIIKAYQIINMSPEGLRRLQDLILKRAAEMESNLVGCVQTERTVALALLAHFEKDKMAMLRTMADRLQVPDSSMSKFGRMISKLDIEEDRARTIKVYKRIREMALLDYYVVAEEAKKESRDSREKAKMEKQGSVTMTLMSPYMLINSTGHKNADISERMLGLAVLLNTLTGDTDKLIATSPLTGEKLEAKKTVQVKVYVGSEGSVPRDIDVSIDILSKSDSE